MTGPEAAEGSAHTKAAPSLVPSRPQPESTNTARLTPETLGEFRVGSLPSIFYVPGFVSEDEEERLLREVHASKAKWTQARERLAVGGWRRGVGAVRATY